jgi:DNA-binding NtrC family response regulator
MKRGTTDMSHTSRQPECISPLDRILIVDDEVDFAHGLARLISGEFTEVSCVCTTSGGAALAELADRGADLMITDLKMPGMDGLALLNQALNLLPNLCVVVITAYGTIETAVEAVKKGAYDFLTKPVEKGDLFRLVQRGLERSRLTRENARLRELVQGCEPPLVGDSPCMLRLRQAVTAIARNNYPVLIRGESGCGKEIVARLIHASSNQAKKPFLSINCPAIPETLLESELFGHEKGAYSGADRSRSGLFVEAGEGTIHLDEIGDISPGVQTKLLRVLQEHEIRPLGSNRAIPVHARVLATTNQDLEAKLAAHSFREDLYYRLNVLSVTVPPLRDRVDDIPLLAQYFLKKTCAELRTSEKTAAPEVLEWLKQRSWPGNVRELQNMMRRLVVFCPGDMIDLHSLRLAEAGQVPISPPSPEIIQSYKESKSRLIRQFTAAYFQELLQATNGNISEAARRSGVSRVALQKILFRLKKEEENDW